jgi:hypothetical protein
MKEEKRVANLDHQIEDMCEASNTHDLSLEPIQDLRKLFNECIVIGRVVCGEPKNLESL